MRVAMSYLGRSGLRRLADRHVLSLQPNLSRQAVAFDAELQDPLRFREAISALHDVVVSNLRFQPRDKTEYEAWKKEQQARESAIRRAAYEQERQALEA